MPPHGYGKVKANRSKHEPDVMIIGYGYGGVGMPGLRGRGSLTPTVGDPGSEL